MIFGYKKNGDKYLTEVLNIYIAILVKRILSSGLNFQLSKFNYIHQFSVVYVNVSTKLVETFVPLENVFPKSV